MENKNFGNEQNKVSMLFVVVCVLYITSLLVSNLIAGKMLLIWHIVAPAGVIVFPLSYILGDVITEVYGLQRMRKVIWLGFSCCFISTIFYLVTIALPYPDFWQGQEAFKTVMGITPRLFIASLTGYLFGELSNAVIMSRLKTCTNGKYLWVRTILSTLVGEGLDTIIFISISFYGSVENSILLHMIYFQYVLKVGYEIIFTPVTYGCVWWLKKKEIQEENTQNECIGEK